MRAFLLIRGDPWYRRESFKAGLSNLGYEIHGQPRDALRPGDLLVIWNRYGYHHTLALQFEAAGLPVIVAENGVMGREWRGELWYSLSLTDPACAGNFPVGGPERWDSFGVEFCEWRKGGGEVIILGQRGIGPPGVAMPAGWDRQQLEKYKAKGLPVRFREHPGEKPCIPLEQDLKHASLVVAWSSGAALKALLLGIPVAHGFDRWIGRGCALQSSLLLLQGVPLQWRLDRLPTFRALGWSIWRIREIESGQPFARLLGLGSGDSPTTHAAA